MRNTPLLYPTVGWTTGAKSSNPVSSSVIGPNGSYRSHSFILFLPLDRPREVQETNRPTCGTGLVIKKAFYQAKAPGLPIPSQGKEEGEIPLLHLIPLPMMVEPPQEVGLLVSFPIPLISKEPENGPPAPIVSFVLNRDDLWKVKAQPAISEAFVIEDRPDSKAFIRLVFF